MRSSRLQRRQCLGVAEVVAFHVADRHLQHLSLGEPVRKGRIDCLRAQIGLLADVVLAGIAHQRSGQQARLAENLKAVADAQDQAATLAQTSRPTA